MNTHDAETLLQSWRLGHTSARYESSGGGAGTIAHVPGDHGGASYGEYQLSSRAGTLREYLNQSQYGAKFAGLVPGSPAFDNKWREVAHGDPGFAADQHQFIGRSHYGDQMHRLQARGIDLYHRGPAVQDCVWSTAVQMRALTPRVFERGLKEAYGQHVDVGELTDRQIVEAVQDYKIRHNAELFSKSPTLWNGLLRRAHEERKDLVGLAEAATLAPNAHPRVPAPAPQAPGPHVHRPEHPPHSAPRRHPHAQDSGLMEAQAALAHLGYTGADGRALDVDGRNGRNTHHAISQFQRDQGLHPTGHLDAASRAALKAEDRTMASSTHPLHDLYKQSLGAVMIAERERGVTTGRHSIALAGVVASEAVQAGLTRIDRVEIGANGRFARGVQFTAAGDVPLLNSTTETVNTQAAIQRSLAVSSDQALDVHRRLASVAEHQQRVSAPMRAPVL
ncbi:peptidoglycan-binding protein [Lysobacter sp. TY2-98]|uniref:peptidoglycan-binding domain-containing protein n=1 Tax=Lysobacter sp. TY2-98 TaxID=2290922 RepID=UPI000E20A2BF|nr:peptidoglycan-binding domain-containing protein [Lysobacter sp. TY2-98]AXK72831.1 peptidoglycan-binding protein [Lysobacter sp. TY2-98]